MKATARAALSRGESATGFCRDHPHDNALYNEALAGADKALDDVKTKYGEWLADVGSQYTSTTSLDHFREWLSRQVAKLLRVASAIGRKEPGFDRQFRLPRRRIADVRLIAVFRTILAASEARKADFLRYGIAEGFWDSMRQEIARFEEILQERKASRSGQVGAHTVVDAALVELRGHLDDLDAINTIRFADSPELLAAWKAASKLPSRRKGKADAAGAAAKAASV